MIALLVCSLRLRSLGCGIGSIIIKNIEKRGGAALKNICRFIYRFIGSGAYLLTYGAYLLIYGAYLPDYGAYLPTATF